jgi:site-specific recombinase XerD
MGSFFERRGKWWWRVIGKGNKLATIPVPAEAMDALSRYRIHLGLPRLPTPSDETPLILSVKGRKRIASGMIYKIVKKFVIEVAAAMNTLDPARADKLKQASTHWFRHTAITHQADAGIELRHIKKSARHAKIDTTALYLHSDNDSWHDAVQKHQMKKDVK